jgi:hypothetical protein
LFNQISFLHLIMPNLSTQEVLNELVQNEVTSKVTPTFPNQRPDLKDWATLDPFGNLTAKPDGPLKNYDFGSLEAEKAQDFLRQMDLSRDLPMPQLSDLDSASLQTAPLSHGVPPLQHSIWVGNPLNAGESKQKAFMDSLAKNQADNPHWQVVLWSDRTREEFNNADPDSLIGKMKTWANDSKVVIVSLDEVYAGDNAMEMQQHYKLELNKLGTGRAAASDIARLEVLNRFGGMYVDGDKGINRPLDEVAQSAHDARARLVVPIAHNLQGVNPIPNNAREEQAVSAGTHKIVESNGFSVGNEQGRYQNCTMCATKNNPAVAQIMANIEAKYKLNRAELAGQGGISVLDKDRAQRVEVIERSGPSIIRDTVDPDKIGTALMPQGMVNTFTGTTSWTGEKVFSGGRDLNALRQGGLQDLNPPAALEIGARIAAKVPDPLPATMPALLPEDVQKIGEAVRKSLNSLTYTVPNEAGRLDMNHLKPHIQALKNPVHEKLALHAVVQSLASDEFKNLAEQVTSLRTVKDLPLSKDTLDLLTDPNKLPGLNLSTLTIQDAALEGNLPILAYAAQKGELDLSATTAHRMDSGTYNSSDTGGKMSVLEAAVKGGQPQALRYLMGQDDFKKLPSADVDKLIEMAARYGQLDTVVTLAEKTNNVQALHTLVDNLNTAVENNISRKEDNRSAITRSLKGDLGVEALKRFQNTFGQHPDLKKASAVLLINAVQNNALDTLPTLQNMGVSSGDCSAEERKELVRTLCVRAESNPNQATKLLDAAVNLGLEDEVLLQAAQGKTTLITARLNERRGADAQIAPGDFDYEAEMAAAHTKLPNSEIGKNDYKDVDMNALDTFSAKELVQKAMVYSHDRLRDDQTGKQSRAQGWSNLLEQMKQVDKIKGDPALMNLINATQDQVIKMNSADHSVRNSLRATAKDMDAPDLSQRQTTSLKGTLREMFRKNETVVPSDKTFVPGKGLN